MAGLKILEFRACYREDAACVETDEADMDGRRRAQETSTGEEEQLRGRDDATRGVLVRVD